MNPLPPLIHRSQARTVRRRSVLVLVGLVFAATLHAESSTPARLLNLSTRMQVQPDENVGIAGFTVTGAPKRMIFRALGPSLKQVGISGVLADPVLELYSPNGTLLATNDNWKDDPAQSAVIEAEGLAPKDNLEAALFYTVLLKDAYTAIIRGKSNAIGVGLIEVYDLDSSPDSKLANISTRALVQTGQNIVIAGFTLGSETGTALVAIRGIGPSLDNVGVANPLPDPTIEVRDANGATFVGNDDWGDDTTRAQQLSDVGLAPNHVLEAATIAAFSPGPYTALLTDSKQHTGIGLVEVYDLGAASDVSVNVAEVQDGTTNTVEKQHVSFSPIQTSGTFRITVHRPTAINQSGIGSRAALEGQTAPISFSASAADIVAAIEAIEKSWYAYGQFGNEELTKGNFSYFASKGASNREPVVTLDGKTAGQGFTIQFGSTVGTSPAYNTWVAHIPLITVSVP